MGATPDPVRLYSERAVAYERFVRAVGYPRGLRAYFQTSHLLRPAIRILDAGCGSGFLTFAVHEACVNRGIASGPIHAFDLTPVMLERFRGALAARGMTGVELARCDVLRLEKLPVSWRGYDLVVSASMMEYLPRSRLADALAGLRDRLAEAGTLVLVITRRNFLMRPLIERWWHANLYDGDELRAAFRKAGFASVEFRRFPFPYCYLGAWGRIVEARPHAGR